MLVPQERGWPDLLVLQTRSGERAAKKAPRPADSVIYNDAYYKQTLDKAIGAAAFARDRRLLICEVRAAPRSLDAHDELLSERASADEGLRDAESFEGVSVERRQIIQLSLGAIAALSFRWPQALAASSRALGDGLSWDALLEQAVPIAEKVAQELAPNEEEYLLRISSLIQRLSTVPDVEFERFNPYDDVVFARRYNKFPFTVTELRLEPGAAIPYHDHRDYNGVLRILGGDAQIRSFEVIGTDSRPPSGKPFLIRETKREFLTAGQLSTLSRTRDNIHDIRAGTDGARLLDVFTYLAKDGKSTYLNVDERSGDPARRIYEASWRE